MFGPPYGHDLTSVRTVAQVAVYGSVDAKAGFVGLLDTV